ncbi:MAG: SDR family oxidoreductase [Pseudomonadota bacterium]
MSRRVLITGGSRGIGAASAKLGGAQGWSVGVNYLSNETAAGDVVEAVKLAGGRAVAIQADASVEAEIVAMFDQMAEAFGGINGVVINAGVLDERMPLAEMDADRIRRIIDVNVTGALLTAREAARRMSLGKGGQGGAIVIVSSAAARLGGAGEYVDYAASKGAMDALTLGLSKELGPEGVRVNAIRPGLIETDIHASSGWPQRAQELGKSVPLQRAGTAEETAEAICWLLSDASSYVNGALLDVTGGR